MKQLTIDDARRNRGWGGLRDRAGRKPKYRRPPVHHVRRPRVPGKCPCHVRLRVRKGVPSLRTKRFMKAFRETMRRGCERGDFRVVHYSVQRTHVHLIVEAQGKEALGRGMKSVGSRFARAVQRTFGIEGPVVFGRYWLRILRTAREVRHALAYVLLNARKHYFEARRQAPPVQLDVCSSGLWFDGWRRPPPAAGKLWERDVGDAHTELLSVAWRRHGRVDPAEVPGGRARRAA